MLHKDVFFILAWSYHDPVFCFCSVKPAVQKEKARQVSLPGGYVVEVFPYRNGSKAVMALRVPAILTSPNSVDYKAIVNEAKSKLMELTHKTTRAKA